MVRVTSLLPHYWFSIIACGFGYMTHGKIDGLNAQIVTLNGNVNTANQAAALAKASLKSAQDELAKTKTEAEQAKSQLASTQSDLEAANAKATSLTAQVADLQKQVDQAKLTGTSGIVASTGPTVADMDALNKKLTDSQAAVAELTQVKETLTNKAKDAESRADDLEKVVAHYKQGTVKNGLEGEVLAYNPGWNFVVLSIGDRQGAVANAEMILQRGGSQIGKVRITSSSPPPPWPTSSQAPRARRKGAARRSSDLHSSVICCSIQR